MNTARLPSDNQEGPGRWKSQQDNGDAGRLLPGRLRPPSPGLRIEAVENRRQHGEFHRVKRDLYRHDRAAVIPLKRMEWLQLDTARHPFYQHARRKIWVVHQGRRPVGRIAAIVDDLHNSHCRDRTGFFGFFESVDDPAVAELLLDTAVDWLRKEGCDAVRGPVNPSMKSDFGVLLEGHSHSPYIMMGHTHRYYDGLLTGYGLRPVKRFHSFLYIPAEDNHEALVRFGKLGEVCERLQKRFPELSVRTGTRRTLEPMLREINRIGNVIRSRGWGFVPMTEAELDFSVAQIRRVIDPQTVVGCYLGERMVGYNVSIPNVNWAIRKCWGSSDWIRLPQLFFWLRRIPEVRCIAVGVDPETRNRGISALVTKSMTDLWNRYERWEFGWIAEDNLASMDALDRALPLRKYKTYQVYEAPIGPSAEG